MTLPIVEDKFHPERESRRVREAVNALGLRGVSKNTGDVTLTANTTTTTVTDQRVSVSQFIDFMPTSASGAKEWHSGSMYVSSQTNGEFTITHTNCSETDRTFRYVFFG